MRLEYRKFYRRPLVTRHIVGFKKDESDHLLKFLYDHIAYGADFQARVKWAEKTVVVWDVSNIRYYRFTRHVLTFDRIA